MTRRKEVLLSTVTTIMVAANITTQSHVIITSTKLPPIPYHLCSDFLCRVKGTIYCMNCLRLSAEWIWNFMRQHWDKIQCVVAQVIFSTELSNQTWAIPRSASATGYHTENTVGTLIYRGSPIAWVAGLSITTTISAERASACHIICAQ